MINTRKNQHRNKPLVTIPMEPELKKRIDKIAIKYKKTKTDVYEKSIRMGLNELEHYYKMEIEYFDKLKLNKKTQKKNNSAKNDSSVERGRPKHNEL